jgi:hypothetical protein
MLFSVLKASTFSQASYKNAKTLALKHIIFKSCALNLISWRDKHASAISLALQKFTLLEKAFFSLVKSHELSFRGVIVVITKD